MTTLIIARHGNTFESGETPRRIGARTDMSLTETGREQAGLIGKYLKENNMIPDVVYTSNLKRTQETATIAIHKTGIRNPTFPLDIFNEIDYGPDENKTEDDVIARLGKQAIKDWNEKAIVPNGWNADPDQIIKNWQGFARQITAHDDGEIVLVVTSNGIARFAPHLTGDFDEFLKNHDNIRMATGALCVLKHTNDTWAVTDWNIRLSKDP